VNTIRRKAKVPLDVGGTRLYLDAVLRPLWPTMPAMALYNRTLDLQARYRCGRYECPIIAAAIDAGCRRLGTEVLPHGQRIERLRMEDPFID